MTNSFHLQVTWFRRKDFHLLTVGHAVYSSDERFHAQGPVRSILLRYCTQCAPLPHSLLWYDLYYSAPYKEISVGLPAVNVPPDHLPTLLRQY